MVVLIVAINTVDVSTWADRAVGLKWSKAVIDFLKANTQGLIILVAFSLLLEFVGIERSRKEDRQIANGQTKLISAFLDNTPGATLIDIGLQSIVGDSSAEVGKALEIHRPPMRNASISIHIGLKDNRTVQIAHKLEFNWTGGSLLYAVVRDSDALNSALARIPELLELTELKDPSRSLTDFVDSLNDDGNSPFQFIQKNGLTSSVVLSRVGNRTKSRICSRAGIEMDKIELLRADVAGVGRLRVMTKQEHAVDIGYAWWMADRLIELSSARLDASSLSHAYHLDAPMLFANNNQLDPPSVLSPGIWELQGPGWFLPGNALEIRWTRNSI
ncbi:hypothetical protein [Mycolicibacterium fortuitum]|uniref:hypothetical protein n=1 Tax=Mycolicibacterium fortuitum TaxID=1766 RepID=UPI003AAAF5D0